MNKSFENMRKLHISLKRLLSITLMVALIISSPGITNVPGWVAREVFATGPDMKVGTAYCCDVAVIAQPNDDPWAWVGLYSEGASIYPNGEAIRWYWPNASGFNGAEGNWVNICNWKGHDTDNTTNYKQSTNNVVTAGKSYKLVLFTWSSSAGDYVPVSDKTTSVLISHKFGSATCTTAATCACGTTSGNALGHDYSVSVTSDKTGHSKYKCSRCTSTTYVVNNYYFDVNHTLDGASMGNSLNSGVGTFDVYIGGSKKADNVGDYYTQHPYNSSYQVTDIQAKTGYHYVSNSGGLTGNLPASNKAVVLNWARNTYQVRYNANGGSGSMSNSTHSYGIAKNLTANGFTKTGYTFAGWATSASGNVTYNNQQSVTNLSTTHNAVIDLYAKWTANTNTKYTVNHYQMNTSGSYPSTATATETKTGTSDAGLTLANLKKTYTGFTYDHGKVGNSTVTTTTIAADGSRVINLYYKRNQYTVTLNKGTGISSVSGAGTYYYGQNVTINATPSTGYTWSSWSGTHSTATQNYSFTMSTSNVTDTANATANTYQVKYEANGGTGTMDNSSHTYDTTKELTSNGYEKTGYTFSHWNTAADNTGTRYENNASVSNLTSVNGGTVTLHAQWTAKQYTVTLDYNAEDDTTLAGNTVASVTATFNQAYPALPEPTRDGKIFAGWFDESDQKVTCETVMATADAHTLTAKWVDATGSIEVAETIAADDIRSYSAFGNPTFIYEAEALSGRTYYKSLVFTADDLASADEDGNITKKVTFENMPVDTYTVSMVKTYRYNVSAPVTAVLGIHDNDTDGDAYKEFVVFSNAIRHYKWFSHNAFALIK